MAAETAGVPGLDDDTLARLVAQAEAGYDLATDVIRTEENPHFQKLRLVPEDLGEAILNRAIRDGRTPDEIVRAAIEAYLHAGWTLLTAGSDARLPPGA